MADATTVRPPKWFWIVASIAFVWNLMGVAAYLMQVTMSDETLAALPAEQQALYASTPAWATGAFALAVFGGALGCLFLLLRKSWAGWGDHADDGRRDRLLLDLAGPSIPRRGMDQLSPARCGLGARQR